jgi:hypothetical protein
LCAGFGHFGLAGKPALDVSRPQILDLDPLANELHKLFEPGLAESIAFAIVVLLDVLQPTVGDLGERQESVRWFAQVVLVEQELELPLRIVLVGSESVKLPGNGTSVLPLALLPVQTWGAATHSLSSRSEFLAQFLALHLEL